MKYYKNETNGEVFGFDETDATQLPYMQEKIDAGYTDITGSYPPPPQPTPIPNTVSMRQARLALFQQGLLTNVQTAIDGLAEPAKTTTQISWDYATVIQRDDELVVQLSTALGLTQEQLDTLFTKAATL